MTWHHLREAPRHRGARILDESRLDDLLPGLRILETGFDVPQRGRQDAVAIDEDGQFVLVEIARDAVGTIPAELLDRMQWFDDHRALLPRLFGEGAQPAFENDAAPPTRAALLAPAFKDTLVRARSLDPSIELLRVRALTTPTCEWFALVEPIDDTPGELHPMLDPTRAPASASRPVHDPLEDAFERAASQPHAATDPFGADSKRLAGTPDLRTPTTDPSEADADADADTGMDAGADDAGTDDGGTGTDTTHDGADRAIAAFRSTRHSAPEELVRRARTWLGKLSPDITAADSDGHTLFLYQDQPLVDLTAASDRLQLDVPEYGRLTASDSHELNAAMQHVIARYFQLVGADTAGVSRLRREDILTERELAEFVPPPPD